MGERIHFTEDSEKFMPLDNNQKKKNLIYLLATWKVFQKGRKEKKNKKIFQYITFSDFLNMAKAHAQVAQESQASAQTS